MGESTAVDALQAVNVVQRFRIDSTLLGMEMESIPFFRSDDTGRSKTRFASRDWTFIIMERFK